MELIFNIIILICEIFVLTTIDFLFKEIIVYLFVAYDEILFKMAGISLILLAIVFNIIFIDVFIIN